jgi:translin
VSRPDLADLVEPVRHRFRDRHEARETAYAASREAVRAAADAIRSIHRGETDRAEDLAAQSRAALATATAAVADHPDVLYGGFVQDAAKEYAEARMTAAAAGRPPPPAGGGRGAPATRLIACSRAGRACGPTSTSRRSR